MRPESLVLAHVTKRFGGVTAVSDVSFEIPPGRITGLIGPNGAGKSTLVNMIAGVLTLSEGEIRLGSRQLGQARSDEVARAGIARTFQNIRLLPEASVLDNVVVGFHRLERTSLAANLLGLPSAWREGRLLREQARALLARFGMSRYEAYPAGGLSYGHQRRVEMMRALATQPLLLMLDEPVAGMNDVEAGGLGEIFASLAQSGMAVLLIEHNVPFVMGLCTHIHVLDTGRLIASGPPATVMRNEAVVAAYLGAA
jgi:branched-chain amino acid transport system ATP-binding protein